MHLHAPYNPSMCAIAPLAIPTGAIGVATYHSVFAPGVLLDVFAPILRRWLGKLDAHVVVSEACIGSLAPYFPYDYRIIPNGIDDRHFSPDAEPLPELREGGKPLILFLGRFDPRNGLPTMLEAFQQVHAEHEGSVRLCVVGDGPLGNVYRRKLPERVADDVIWAGRVDWSRPRYYASADIHCTPCQRASFGMVLLEAMSTGRPVVASRISGFQLLMEHGKQGLMVSPRRRREPLRAGAAVPARPPRRARAHGPRGAHHRRHALRLVERRRAARAALRRAARRASGARDEEARGRPALRRRLGRGDRRRRGALAAVVGTALAGWAGWAFFGARLPARPPLGLGLVHAQLAALRQGRDRARDERPRARADVRRRALLRVDAARARRAARERRARDLLRARPPRRGAPRADPPHQRGGPRDRLARLRPRAAHVRLAGRRRPPARAHRGSLATALGEQPHPLLFRAPHGFRNPFVARATSRRGYEVVGWTKGVWDTAKPGVEAIVRRTIGGFRPGGILLLHDADGSGAGDDRSQTAEAVPEIVERAHAAGYELVTVSELADARARQAHGDLAHRRRPRALRRAARARAAHGRHQHGQRRRHRLVVGRRVARRSTWLSILLKAVVWKAALDTIPDQPRFLYAHVVPALFVGFLLNTLLPARLGEIGRVSVLQRRLR